jgi:hypothetical protein
VGFCGLSFALQPNMGANEKHFRKRSAPESEDPSEDDEEIRCRTDRLGRGVFVEWSWDWYTGIGF